MLRWRYARPPQMRPPPKYNDQNARNFMRQYCRCAASRSAANQCARTERRTHNALERRRRHCLGAPNRTRNAPAKCGPTEYVQYIFIHPNTIRTVEHARNIAPRIVASSSHMSIMHDGKIGKSCGCRIATATLTVQQKRKRATKEQVRECRVNVSAMYGTET